MNTQSTVDKTKEALDNSRLRGEIDDLTSQVERLHGELRRLGRSGVRAAKAGASHGLDALGRTKDDLAEGIGRELAHAEERASTVVRERPVQSLGVAIAIGFLLAIFLRR
jgi:ElaB/YqjD/DUF883 family membrane-anchored ribosome-binding protein